MIKYKYNLKQYVKLINTFFISQGFNYFKSFINFDEKIINKYHKFKDILDKLYHNSFYIYKYNMITN